MDSPFTLIEMIVVLLFLGVLAALLVPAISPAIVCGVPDRQGANTLSHLVKATYGYAFTRDPVDGKVPAAPGFTGGSPWPTLYEVVPNPVRF